LQQREQDLKENLVQLEEEKKTFDAAKTKEEELLKRDEELQKMRDSLNKEKSMAEETIAAEMEELEKREKEISERERMLRMEQEFAQKSLDDRIKELEEREKKLLDEKSSLSVESSSKFDRFEKMIEEFKQRESLLLNRIEELEKKSTEKPLDPAPQQQNKVAESTSSAEALPRPSDKEPQHSFQDLGDEFVQEEYKILANRDLGQIFQTFEYFDVKIILINLERATTNFAIEFKDYLEREIVSGSLKIVVDLNNCEFIDSTFLGLLVKYLKKLNYEGGDLKVVLKKDNSSSTMFYMSGMDRVFRISESISDAVRNFIDGK
jgi:anti-anti-sigma factor